MRYSRPLMSLLALLVLAAAARGAILRVPTQYPTIQAAIDAAADGDTVLVGPGTYFENLQLDGKAIVLESLGGAEVTTIDGNGREILLAGSREDAEARLSGFTLTHGDAEFGGAISCVGAWLEVSDCRFLDNSARFDGGALYAASFNTAPLLIVRCTFAHNRSSMGAVRAIGVAQLTVSDCVFLENGPRNDFSRGGALAISSVDTTIIASRFQGNSAMTGGALIADFSPVTIADCSFEADHALRDGGAARLDSCTVTIARTRFAANTAVGLGGALAAQDSTLDVTDTVFLDNRAIAGGAAHLEGGLDGVELQGCTFTRNAAGSGGALALIGAGTPRIASCILWGNHASDSPQIQAGRDSPDIRYSDVQGGWPGTGNIDLDPGFRNVVHGDLSLAATSPCIDAGDPALRPATKDLARRPRWLDGNLDGISRVDMGALELGNVALTVLGPGTPGSTLTIVTTGRPGLDAMLFVAAAQGSALLAPYGPLFFDLTQPWLVFPFVVIPPSGSISVAFTIPLGLPTPLTLVLQELGIEPLASAGNVSSERLLEIP